MGLHFPPERRSDLHRGLNEAAPELGFEDAAACAEGLLSAPLSGRAAAHAGNPSDHRRDLFLSRAPELQRARDQVLPELIHRKRGRDRRLRLWSAACSTGEEAYSLAILVQQLLPDWRDWQISILATDINAAFPRKGRSRRLRRLVVPRVAAGVSRALFHAARRRALSRCCREMRERVTFARTEPRAGPLSLARPTTPMRWM